MITDNRRGKRTWLSAPAVIANFEGTIISACRVIDVSQTGMQLTLLSAVKVSGAVTIILSRDGSVRRKAVTKWQAGRDIGVQFDRRYDGAASADQIWLSIMGV